MSRPHLLAFMSSGDLPYHYVGDNQEHRKIMLIELQEFMGVREAGQKITSSALNSASLTHEEVAPLLSEEIDELMNLWP